MLRTCKIVCCGIWLLHSKHRDRSTRDFLSSYLFFFFKYMEDLSFVHICYHHIFNQRSYAECNIRTTFRSTSVNHPGMEKGPCITLTVLMALLTWNSCIHIQRILKERLLRNIFLMHNYNILLGYQNLKC